ncbi:MAG: hypothetical protein VYC71_03635, partial [Planctomycetota bacterium]|nr:hypothetical protein [Planctomycetota bacterium]
DFSAAFTFSVYTNGDESDWLWNRNPVGVGICTHRGGDVRGNYSMPRFFVVDDCIGEAGFFDWTFGWFCDEVSQFPVSEEEWTRFGMLDRWRTATLEGMLPCQHDRINEEASQGYASNPTCHLADLLGTDDCYWFNGSAYVREPETGHVYRVAPQYFCDGLGGEELIDTPDNGDGWLHDASIDTDAWIEAVLKSGGREVTEEVYALVSDEHGQDPEWDDSEGVAEAFSLIIGRESCE